MPHGPAYLHCSFNSAAEAGKDTPYYSLYQKAVFAVMQGWAWVYSILLTAGDGVRTVLPPDGAFAVDTQKMHSANGRAVAAAVWRFSAWRCCAVP